MYRGNGKFSINLGPSSQHILLLPNFVSMEVLYIHFDMDQELGMRG